jgi:hypothetical protein
MCINILSIACEYMWNIYFLYQKLNLNNLKQQTVLQIAAATLWHNAFFSDHNVMLI